MEYPENINGISYIGRPKPHTAMFVVKKVEYLIDALYDVEGCLVFAEENIEIPEELKSKHRFVMAKNAQEEYNRFAEKIYNDKAASDRKRRYTLTDGGYTVGENVQIGTGSYIAPGCVIGHDVVIGDNAEICSNAVIKNARIGHDCIIREGAVIGSDGFTFTINDGGNWYRTPSMGGVIIGDHVEIGTNACVAGGTADATVIGDYVKMDALTYVGHDAHIAVNTEISAGGIVGGYVETGDRTLIGFNASVRNRLTIEPYSVIGMGAVVTKNIKEGEVVIGNPAHEYIKK